MSVTNARPVIERIAVVLYDRLNQLTAGYAPTSPVVEVIRPKRLADYTPRHFQIVLVQGDVEQVQELYCPGNPPKTAYQQTFNIYCHLMPSEKDPTPIDEYANTFHADVVEVITDAGANWMQFGGLAIDAEFQAPVAIDSDGGADGFRLPLDVIYRTSELTPYQVTA